MRIIDKIDGGLVVLIDWPHAGGIDYGGFDGKAVWPDAEWQSENSDTLRSLNKLIPQQNYNVTFNPFTVKNGLASVNVLEDIIKYKCNIQELNRLLYIKFTNFDSPVEKIVENRFKFLGYDYGNYISEDNYYSLIFHEIIAGKREEFKHYTRYLNKNMLFSSLDHISQLEKTKEELRAKGEHLEDERENEEFQPIAVYVFGESN